MLCKGVDETGITFYTNYDSDKGPGLGSLAVRVGDLPVVRARPPGPPARRRREGGARGDGRILVQAAPRVAAGDVGVASVPPRSRLREALAKQLADVTERFAGVESVPVARRTGVGI